MDVLYDFLNWAWARHHNPLSWYIRPLFVLPYCYFAYKKSAWSIIAPVGLGAVVIDGVMAYAYWRTHRRTGDDDVGPRAVASRGSG